MRLWIVINGAGNVSEDTVYLVGRLACRFDRLLVSHLADDAECIPPPPGEVDVILQRFRTRNLALFEEIDRVGDSLGVPVTNPGWTALRAKDKRTLPDDFPALVPPTRTVGNMEAFHEAFEAFSGDVVIKDPFGKGGWQVHRVRSPADADAAQDLLASARCGEIVVQPFMAGFADGDRRIITVRGPDGRHRAIAGITRHPPAGGWKCNLSGGGVARIADPTPEEAAVAADVGERTGMDVAHLDFGWHEGRLYLIETNQGYGGLIDYDIGERGAAGDTVAACIEHLARHGRS